MPADVLIKIFHAATWRLEQGNFYVRFTKPMHPGLKLSKYPVTMHALRTLHLLLYSPSQDTRLFSLLRLPALQSLCIEMHDYYQDWDIPLYIRLLRASKKTLRQLYMDEYPPHGSDIRGFVVRRRYRKTPHRVLAAFFRAIPNVEILHLPLGLEIDARTLEKMGSYTLLPKLSWLELSSVRGWPILTMAQRRLTLFVDASRAAAQLEFQPGPSTAFPINNTTILRTLPLTSSDTLEQSTTYTGHAFQPQTYNAHPKPALWRQRPQRRTGGEACPAQFDRGRRGAQRVNARQRTSSHTPAVPRHVHALLNPYARYGLREQSAAPTRDCYLWGRDR
ncbi:hypothetical protein BJ912DRAFT_1079485 [Pholiota molesta]|nr:hypothetical protein BJ912DRAFT_1079485 [Pholiota molesta]